MEILLLIGLVCIAVALYASHANKKRREALLDKYGNEEIVEKIMKRMFWQGQTPEQLIDSIGNPLDIDKKVMKTKVKEVWKYQRTGKGRYALRITLENDSVVGWDKKS